MMVDENRGMNTAAFSLLHAVGVKEPQICKSQLKDETLHIGHRLIGRSSVQ